MRSAWLVFALCLVASPAYAQQGGRLGALRAADTNGDGAITLAEAQAARAAMFERLDANHDGYVTNAERMEARRQAQARRGRQNPDSNDDGRISRAEMMNQPYSGFDRLDRNNDDVVSAEELEAARSMMRAR